MHILAGYSVYINMVDLDILHINRGSLISL